MERMTCKLLKKILYKILNVLHLYINIYIYYQSIKILQNRINKLTEDNEILLNNYNNLSNSYKQGIEIIVKSQYKYYLVFFFFFFFFFFVLLKEKLNNNVYVLIIIHLCYK